MGAVGGDDSDGCFCDSAGVAEPGAVLAAVVVHVEGAQLPAACLRAAVCMGGCWLRQRDEMPSLLRRAVHLTRVAALQGEVYRLVQFHFHSPSEHSVDGKLMDAEMHLVHQSAAGNVRPFREACGGPDSGSRR